MKFNASKQIETIVDNIIHKDTQLHKRSIDLTVASISRFTASGALDFGGGEFKEAHMEPVEPKKKQSGDDYGWWELEQGIYKAAFNESFDLSPNMLCIITPHAHARDAGLIANATLSFMDESSSFCFHVPEIGCQIKENARLAVAYVINLDQ